MCAAMNKEFRLVIPAKPYSGWYGGWAAGSIPAHFIHCKKEGKVFWYQSIFKKGFGKWKGIVDKEWNRLRKNPGLLRGDPPFISDVGYFYESGTKKVTWQFKLEKILQTEEISEDEKRYIPSFREVYLKEREEWILISEMKKLKNPVTFIDGNDFRFLTLKGEVKPKSYHIRNNCFVSSFPNIDEKQLEDPKPEELLDTYLKQYLLKGSRSDKFREGNVQEALLMALVKKGVIFAKEGVLDLDDKRKGRFDFLVRKEENFLAFELKVDDDVKAPKQLKEYIESIVVKEKIPPEKIKGYIICGNPSQETIEKASDFGFEVIEYKLKLDFPKLDKILT